ncbi:hypothetical protein EVAR_63709_1 [Eumeta japonica]|uniref:Uncharacterized protein n=1 Tax=Eumeta variegata TaxID=151549 RepID=A0A4C1ZVI2_EUMVA|nr:hypothetical protein EVAR_63709_1 [Eumeta japonica]
MPKFVAVVSGGRHGAVTGTRGPRPMHGRAGCKIKVNASASVGPVLFPDFASATATNLTINYNSDFDTDIRHPAAPGACAGKCRIASPLYEAIGPNDQVQEHGTRPAANERRFASQNLSIHRITRFQRLRAARRRVIRKNAHSQMPQGEFQGCHELVLRPND